MPRRSPAAKAIVTVTHAVRSLLYPFPLDAAPPIHETIDSWNLRAIAQANCLASFGNEFRLLGLGLTQDAAGLKLVDGRRLDDALSGIAVDDLDEHLRESLTFVAQQVVAHFVDMTAEESRIQGEYLPTILDNFTRLVPYSIDLEESGPLIAAINGEYVHAYLVAKHLRFAAKLDDRKPVPANWQQHVGPEAMEELWRQALIAIGEARQSPGGLLFAKQAVMDLKAHHSRANEEVTNLPEDLAMPNRQELYETVIHSIGRRLSRLEAAIDRTLGGFDTGL